MLCRKTGAGGWFEPVLVGCSEDDGDAGDDGRAEEVPWRLLLKMVTYLGVCVPACSSAAGRTVTGEGAVSALGRDDIKLQVAPRLMHAVQGTFSSHLIWVVARG